MKTKMVSDLMNEHRKHFDYLCNELSRLHGQQDSSDCNRKIALRSHLTSEYVCLNTILRVAFYLDDLDAYEFDSKYDELENLYNKAYFKV